MQPVHLEKLVPTLLVLTLQLAATGCARRAEDVAIAPSVNAASSAAEDEPRDERAPAASAAPVGPQPDDEPTTYAGSHLALGIDLLRTLSAAAPSKNLLLSPTSIGLAFSMTWAGARGETAREMEKTLHLTKLTATVPTDAGAMMNTLNQQVKGGPTLRLVNRLFAEQKPEAPLLPAYLSLTRDQFLAPVEFADFKTKPEPSRKHINQWVKSRTEDRIVDLLPGQSITTLTRLVLTNAVYFLGKWEAEFRRERTTPRPFHVGPGVSKNVPTMSQTAPFAHAELEDVTVVDLPYKGAQLSMVVFLPTAQDGLAALEARLTPALISEWLRALRPSPVALTLPKFEARYETRLKAPLQALGMKLAFDAAAADLSGMNGARDLYVDEAYHQTFIKVDESGTEAAAATAVVVNTKSARPPATRITVDHPFLFLIKDRRTDSILFLGRLVDPSASP